MRKYILIFGYTYFTENETNFWNNLSLKLNREGYELILFSHVEPKYKCFFFTYKFVFKLDDIELGLFTENDYQDDIIFEKYLERERIWWGNSKKDRLTAAKFMKYRYNLLLEELNPSLVVLGNGEHAIELILKQEILDRKIPLIYFERGCLPNSWHLDKVGITAGSVIALKNISELKLESKKNYVKYKDYYLKNKITWWEQPTKLEDRSIRERYNISKNTKVILFVNQLDCDTSNFKYSPNFSSNLEAFKWLCSELRNSNFDCFIFAKKHPRFDSRYIDFENVINETGLKGVWNDDIPLSDCLVQCDLVCAVNSTSIYEAMIYEKPVLQLGKSILSKKNVVYELIDLKKANILIEWFNKIDFNNKLENFEYLMSYIIEYELAFFDKDIEYLNFNNHEFYGKKIIELADFSREGKIPVKFIESNMISVKSMLKKITFKKLFLLNFKILIEMKNRVIKKCFN